MAAPGDPDYHPINDPAIKGAAAAWHSVIDYAEQCAEAAQQADTSRLNVTGDYLGALDELHASLRVRALHEVHDAAIRFQRAVVTPTDLAELVGGGRGEKELAVLGAVIMLRGALLNLSEAQGRLRERFPDPEDP